MKLNDLLRNRRLRSYEIEQIIDMSHIECYSISQYAAKRYTVKKSKYCFTIGFHKARVKKVEYLKAMLRHPFYIESIEKNAKRRGVSNVWILFFTSMKDHNFMDLTMKGYL